ncbi:ea153f7d-7e81-4a73-a44c-fb147887f085 [Thermothielavioides terrestris]|uniref:Ea153f7d-7e81-4a73-a44c-fb147887f085 n=1 Tax=Thermothielavioides terrestris TaxID=2587410 RepID=A0A3S4F513_9PEZI|nr:ea153f7d-7e81-4a73-a44c-fb147887f085 [Thermothielavioides terrestris]
MAGIVLRNQLRTLKSVAWEETDFLLAVQHQRDADDFRQRISGESDSIAAVVRHHLRLRADDSCVVLPPESWIQGGFNLCVLVDVQSRQSSRQSSRRFVFRCPLPHKLAEHRHPGTIDEKVACEVATYCWMQEHCADVRIPHLYAFGFADGSRFVHIQQRPWYVRIRHGLRKWIYRLLGYPLLSNYVRDTRTPAVNTAYMLLEHIGPETGKMLSTTNIFVDDDWNVTCLLDLEWICALPAQMLAVPHWLTDCAVDDIVGAEYETFDQVRRKFLSAMDQEIKTSRLAHDVPITRTMQDSWSSKAVWFWLCIMSINGWLFVFEDHILPKFGASKDLVPELKQVSALWIEDIDAVVKNKVEDEAKYQEELCSLFASQGAPKDSPSTLAEDNQPPQAIPL